MQSTSQSASAGEPASAAAGDGAKTHADPKQAVHRLGSLIGEFREYLVYFLAAQADNVKSKARRTMFYAALGVVGLIAGATMIVTAAAILLLGAAYGLGLAMGGRIWLGAVVVGAAVLAGVLGGGYVLLGRMTRLSRRRTVEKYEQRQNWQRGRFGRNVAEQAAAGDGQRG